MPKPSEKLTGLEINAGIGPDAYLAHLIGYTDYEILNASNLTPQRIKNCRFVTVDIDGWAKITYEDPFGGSTKTEVKYLIGGAEYHIRNVTAWEALSVLSSDDYPASQVANGSEVLSDGIKLHR
jgi:hypothetical protein